jgi:hypothetical protein
MHTSPKATALALFFLRLSNSPRKEESHHCQRPDPLTSNAPRKLSAALRYSQLEPKITFLGGGAVTTSLLIELAVVVIVVIVAVRFFIKRG